MKGKKYIHSVLLAFSLFFISPFVLALELQSPPVEIEFLCENEPNAGGIANILLRISAHENLHAEISIVMEQKIEIIERGILVGKNMETNPLMKQREISHPRKTVLFVGKIDPGETREFVFSIAIPDVDDYSLIAVVNPLSKWSEKAQELLISVQ
jgi:hypothetical protein